MTAAPLPRTFLYVPGNRPELFGKALQQGADAVIMDLEDAVPEAEKTRARETVAAFLNDRSSDSSVPILVRVNAGAAALDDVASLPVGRLAGVRMAKCESPEVVAQLAQLLTEQERDHEQKTGLRSPTLVIHATIETIAGLYGLDALAHASNRLTRFAFGASDFVRDIGGQPSPERTETLYARSLLVARSRFLNLQPPIAHVFTPIDDLEGLRRACEVDRSLGFYGRPCIHPKQVAVVNSVFSASAGEVERAQRIVEAYQEASKTGRGALRLDDGTFIDAAGLKRAQIILTQYAQRAGEKGAG